MHSLSALKIRGQKYSWTMCYVSLVSRYSLIKRGKPDKVVGRFRRLYKRKKGKSKPNSIQCLETLGAWRLATEPDRKLL